MLNQSPDKTNMIPVSIVIPAHNAEKTIQNSVDSIESQLNFDAEIVIVENGSTDATYETIQKLSAKYQNIKVMRSEKGVCNARNAGLKAARGKWVMFVDADDTIAEGFGEIISKCMEDDSVDVWMFGHTAGAVKRSVTDSDRPQYYNGDEETKQAIINFLKDPTRFLQAWAKLFKSDIIRENSLCFNPDLSLAEDSDFTLRYLKCCKTVCLSNFILYHYSIYDTSVMRSFSGNKREEYLKSMTVTGKYFDYTEEIRYAFLFYVLMHMNIIMVREIFLSNNGLSESEKYKQMLDTMHLPVFSEAIAAVSFKDCLSVRMSPILFAKMHWYPLCKALYKARVKMNMKKEGKKI